MRPQRPLDQLDLRTKPHQRQLRLTQSQPAAPVVETAPPRPVSYWALPSEPVGKVGLRIGVMAIVAVIALTAVGLRLMQVQVFDRDRFLTFAATQGTATQTLDAPRGALLDRNLSVLAVSDARPTIYADPAQVLTPTATAAALAEVLDVEAQALAARLRSDARFVYVAREVTPELAEQVTALELDGVGIIGEQARLRPNGDTLAVSVIGLVDIDEQPLSGAEAQFTEHLTGSGGQTISSVSRDGLVLPDAIELYEPASPGHDVVLSLHTEVQWHTEHVLLDALATTGARGATAVVMETATGDLLAVAGVTRDAETGEARVTRHSGAFVDAFEPGSVMKTFTVAATLEEELASADEVIAAPVAHTFADREFVEPFRTEPADLTVTEVLATSSNVGTIKLAERLGVNQLHRYLQRFGLGQRTGPGGAESFPGESRGILAPPWEWHGTELATVSFGQGVAVTPIQLTAAYNTLANGGVYVPPRLGIGTIGADGILVSTGGGATHRVVSATTAAEMVGMLRSVVTDGTGKRASIDRYAVAGKTGTAQKPSPDGGYAPDDYMTSFAGFAPADDPAFTVVVVFDEPTQPLAGVTAAPAFSRIAEFVLRVMQLPGSSDEPASNDLALVAAPQRPSP